MECRVVVRKQRKRKEGRGQQGRNRLSRCKRNGLKVTYAGIPFALCTQTKTPKTSCMIPHHQIKTPKGKHQSSFQVNFFKRVQKKDTA